MAISNVFIRRLDKGIDQVDLFLLLALLKSDPGVRDVTPRPAPYHLLDFVIEAVGVVRVANFILSQEPHGLVLTSSHLIAGM